MYQTTCPHTFCSVITESVLHFFSNSDYTVQFIILNCMCWYAEKKHMSEGLTLGQCSVTDTEPFQFYWADASADSLLPISSPCAQHVPPLLCMYETHRQPLSKEAKQSEAWIQEMQGKCMNSSRIIINNDCGYFQRKKNEKDASYVC